MARLAQTTNETAEVRKVTDTETFVMLPKLSDKDYLRLLRPSGEMLTISKNTRRGKQLSACFARIMKTAKTEPLTVECVNLPVNYGWVNGRWSVRNFKACEIKREKTQ